MAPSVKEKGKELTPARVLAFELWQENPQITGPELGRALKEKGFEVLRGTSTGWLARFKKGGGVQKYDGKKRLPGVKPRKHAVAAAEPSGPAEPAAVETSEPVAVKPGKITLEQIIKAVGSVEALSLLFYQGVMEELKRRDSGIDVLRQECLEKDGLISGLKRELEDITRERNRLLREFNEKLAKVKVGTLTLDQVEHRLIPKSYK